MDIQLRTVGPAFVEEQQSRPPLLLIVRSGSELGVRDSALMLRQRPSPRPVVSDDETVGSAGERASQERELADRS